MTPPKKTTIRNCEFAKKISKACEAIKKNAANASQQDINKISEK
jgi:hypothetical protein